MELSFRLAGEADIDLLAGLMRQFYAIDRYPFDEQIVRTALAKLIGDHSLGRVWLINDGEAAIGYIVLTFSYSLEFHGRDAFVDEFFVQAGDRGRGVGTKAMQFVDEACRELGVQALHLEVERANVAAQALYRKFGFADHDRYLMTKWFTT